jgi:D-serine deaminase-like pyridoxal phosphate-dependent protein
LPLLFFVIPAKTGIQGCQGRSGCPGPPLSRLSGNPADRPIRLPRESGILGIGSLEFEAASGVYTELQCGSYIFVDANYSRNRDHDGAPIKTFEPSLFVWATVMSRPAQDRAIVDAGLKALAFDSGPPLVCDEPAATYERASDEHGRLAVSAATNRLALGDKIRLVPGHCDPTVNLYDWYVCIRNNRVEQLWPITARGAIYRRSTNRGKINRRRAWGSEWILCWIRSTR